MKYMSIDSCERFTKLRCNSYCLQLRKSESSVRNFRTRLRQYLGTPVGFCVQLSTNLIRGNIQTLNPVESSIAVALENSSYIIMNKYYPIAAFQWLGREYGIHSHALTFDPHSKLTSSLLPKIIDGPDGAIKVIIHLFIL